jgi:uncharacterized protein YhfF
MATLGLYATDPAPLPTPVGRWRTVDDKTGKPRSIVRIWEENGQYFGPSSKASTPSEDHARAQERRRRIQRR